MNFSSSIAILRTFFEAEAETRIPPLVFASVMMLKPAFHHWRFKIVRTVVIMEFHLILYHSKKSRLFLIS